MIRGLLTAAAGIAAAGAAFAAAAQTGAGDVAKGDDAFQDRCSMCHLDNGLGQGPSLKGVVGRKAGAVPDFPYTDAMKNAGLTWTPENLDKLLQDPAKLVPGTAMPMAVSDPAERRNLIAYLASRS